MSFFNEYKKVIPLNFSASLSYYLVLALVPSFMLVYLVADYLLQDFVVVEEIIKLLFPNDYSNELISFLSKDHLRFSPYLLVIIVLCLNIISNGVANLSRSINIIFNLESNGRLKIKSILLSVLLIIMEGILLFIASFVNYYLSVFTYLRFLILFSIILFAFIFVYRFLPSVPFKIKDIINLSIVGSFIISIVIFAFNIFIDYYSNINLYYGPLSIVVSILILFKLISNIVALVFFIEYKKLKKTSLINKNRL